MVVDHVRGEGLADEASTLRHVAGFGPQVAGGDRSPATDLPARSRPRWESRRIRMICPASRKSWRSTFLASPSL